MSCQHVVYFVPPFPQASDTKYQTIKGISIEEGFCKWSTCGFLAGQMVAMPKAVKQITCH